MVGGYVMRGQASIGEGLCSLNNNRESQCPYAIQMHQR